MIPKIIYELSIFVIFICLFRRFNHLSQDYQTEQRGHGSTSFILIAKILCFFVVTLALINMFLFNVISPLFFYINMDEMESKSKRQQYRVILLHLNWGMQLGDFICCMVILYLIH